MTDALAKWPSEMRFSAWSAGIGGIWRKGRAGREISHEKISPVSCPPATVEWSAERANEVIAPHSTARVTLLEFDIQCIVVFLDQPFVPFPMIAFKLC